MERNFTRSPLRLAAVLTGMLALSGGLTACQPGPTSAAATARAAQSASAATAGDAAPAGDVATAGDAVSAGDASTAAAVAQPAAASGSVTAKITSPIALSGTVATAVSCTSARLYRASVASAVIKGDQVSFVVTIPGYRGPGSYPATVAVTLSQASGVVTTVAGVSRVPAVITDGGGSFSVSATGTAGRTFSGSLAWVCGS